MIKNDKPGELKEEVLGERVQFCVMEFTVLTEWAPEVVTALQEVAKDIDRVFSLGMISRVDEDGTIPALAVLKRNGIAVKANGKTNVGLGHK